MFHKAVNLTFQKGTAFDVLFQDGITKRYDISNLFDKYPQLKALNDRNLFLQGKLMGGYGIMWNDELDIETETIYEDGETISKNPKLGLIMGGIALAGGLLTAFISRHQAHTNGKIEGQHQAYADIQNSYEA